jgi:hydrogenase maturation protease
VTSVVVGVGNMMRRDDGVGPEVVDRVRAARPDVEVVEVNGDASTLVDVWHDRALAVVVDAVRTGASVGTVHRWQLVDGWDDVPLASPGSSHLVGVADAVRLSQALGRLPRRLIVIGVEVADLGDGTGLSAAVSAAVAPAADAVLRALDAG